MGVDDEWWFVKSSLEGLRPVKMAGTSTAGFHGVNSHPLPQLPWSSVSVPSEQWEEVVQASAEVFPEVIR